MWPKIIVEQPRFSTNPDLYDVLGLSLDCSREEVDGIYNKLLSKNPEYDQMTYLAWKVLRDPYYSDLYKNDRSIERLYESGFFVDKVLPDDIHRLNFISGFLTTPFHKILSNLMRLKSDEIPIVLLTTGGFSPIHYGHLAMMETAKKALEAVGHRVVGGYFSPSHDVYVSTKYRGEAELNGDHRIYLSQLAVENSDWLMVDPWESRFVQTSVNFTDVILRLESYLNYYIKYPIPIKIFYVFGSDNAKFVRVFKHRGGCVCVPREVNHLDIKNEEGIRDNPRVVFSELNDYANFSSSAARKWKANLMPEEVSDTYFRWRKNILSGGNEVSRPKRLYVVRDEDTWAISPWIQKFGLSKVMMAKDKFEKEVLQSLRESFLNISMPDLATEIDTRVYHLDEQNKYVERLKKQEKILNLDICTNEDSGINLSRLFYLCDGQLRPTELIARPGYGDIDSQIDRIEAGEYTLLDDDLATGSTVNMLLGRLPENIKINKIRTLADYSRKVYNRNHLSYLDQDPLDIVDLRDFLVGSKNSGLVVSLPNGGIARAPYLEPYVSLISRASIPPSSEMYFSKRLWKINLEFFTGLGDEIYLSDLDSYVQTLFYYLGFKPNMSVKDLCQWHLDQIDFIK